MNLFSRLVNYLIDLAAKRPPDFVIGEVGNPYLMRWWLIPRNRFFNLYLHQFLRSDDLRGFYYEHLTGGRIIRRDAGQVVTRRAVTAHRITLLTYCDQPLPAWSLFITGPVTRQWGFLYWLPRDRRGRPRSHRAGV